MSFADKVVDFAVGDAVSGDYADPTNVLGAPDFTAGSTDKLFALGNPGGTPNNLSDALFGFVTVQFTDNSLTTSNDSAADLFVFEIGSSGGGVIESFQVEISKDASTWIDLGIVSGDAVVGLDIDGVAGVNAGDMFSFVRVTDAPGGATSGNPFGGPDIDAIGAISSAPPVVDPPTGVVPLPAAGWALVTGLAMLFGFRRRT
ncbi:MULTISPECIES: VPLPA-CTERM sorting domain-containing protein [unclassified Roseovarius]|uniref:VPLPA-CTERM sorting domain-containing protein n=1 Tax=unclassified Roseovarius TaxID=2614913 RepID=UPI00273F8256|nr:MULTISPECIES: VPLPA-CTERM sorting domain-containing protein [unclassified Roseovarius]